MPEETQHSVLDTSLIYRQLTDVFWIVPFQYFYIFSLIFPSSASILIALSSKLEAFTHFSAVKVPQDLGNKFDVQ